MTEYFPNADEINLDDVNDESRENIILKNRVWNPEKSFRQMATPQHDKEDSLRNYPPDVKDAILRIMKKSQGEWYREEITLELDGEAIKRIINADSYLQDYEKKAITVMINSVSGGNT